jgi:hypothetical protein
LLVGLLGEINNKHECIFIENEYPRVEIQLGLATVFFFFHFSNHFGLLDALPSIKDAIMLTCLIWDGLGKAQ